ncbi:dTDP-4-dehydrorhamnose reductase [Streptomyces sp. CA-288835]|uniref:dTDP-4-dehydrorhamnose reductase n=1 Tax=Streptomyces sp. CA-288835 TaxID=3240069 RepID=UPI003D9039E7
MVTGAGGLLGQAVVARLRGSDVIALDRRGLDITDPGSVRATMAAHSPDVVVNCAAWTAVDDAETREAEALRINGQGPAHLAADCAATGARLIHVSTDYVFAGDASHPYPENHPTGPRTAYGRTKLAGEQAVLTALPESGFVVRTAWLYGAGGANFVRTMIRLADERDVLDVVDDQWGQPTWTTDLADLLVRVGNAALVGQAAPGVYHGTSTGSATWHELAQEIFRLLGTDPTRVRPVATSAFRRPAPRPGYSVLGHQRWCEAGLAPIRHWRAGLAEAFPALLSAERR